MSFGTVLAQSINIIVQPILTRIVSPESLGIYSYLISLATIIIPVASLKLDMLIVTEEDDDNAQYLTDTCIVISFLLSFISLFIIGLFYNLKIDNPFNRYGPIVFMLPIIILTNGLRFLFISYNNRYREYGLIAKVGVLREGSRAFFQVIYGIISPTVFGQVLGYAIAPIFGFRVQTKNYFLKLSNRKFASFSTIKAMFIEGKNQILYLVPSQFINSFSASLITIYISSLYSPKDLGYYSAGTRILLIPIVFISANVSKVIYKEIGDCVNNNRRTLNTLLKMIGGISIISVVGFALLYYIAPGFSELLFGKGYSVAGIYIRCLIVMYATRLISTSFSGLYTVFGKQQFELLLNVMIIMLATICYYYTKMVQAPIEVFLWMISISYGVVYIIMLLGYVILCKKHDKALEVIIDV